MTVFWLNHREAVRRLREAAAELVTRRPEVEAVHLFGSLAEGRAVPGSDADVLIVLRAVPSARSQPGAAAATPGSAAAGPEAGTGPARWLDRPAAYQPFFEGVGLPVDILCYTREEVERHSFARKALARSLLLAPSGDVAPGGPFSASGDGP